MKKDKKESTKEGDRRTDPIETASTAEDSRKGIVNMRLFLALY